MVIHLDVNLSFIHSFIQLVSVEFSFCLIWKYLRSIAQHWLAQIFPVYGSSLWLVECLSDRCGIVFLSLIYCHLSCHLFCLSEAVSRSCKPLHIPKPLWKGLSHLDACWNAISSDFKSFLESRLLKICPTTIPLFSSQLIRD